MTRDYDDQPDWVREDTSPKRQAKIFSIRPSLAVPPVDSCGVAGCTLTPEEHRAQALLEIRKLSVSVGHGRTVVHPERVAVTEPMMLGDELRRHASQVPHCRMCGAELVGKLDGLCSAKCNALMDELRRRQKYRGRTVDIRQR